MRDTMESAIFAILIAMVATWFALIIWLFRRLRTRHTAVFESLGSPSLFWNNSMRNNWLFLKFLFSSAPHGLSDATLSRVCGFMQVFFAVYLALFVVLIVVTLT
jgi:hypothetical protein